MQNANHALKLFLQEEYAFRRNLLSGKNEFCERKSAAGDTLIYHTLTREDLNSIVLAAEEALPGVKALLQRLEVLIYSRLTPDYDPVGEWLQALPEWDGKNHVGALLDRLPGLSADRRYWMHIWLRSLVAHWLGRDELHANELVPTLIGAQGCGKSTFCRLLLPQELREYFLDHVNLANKFDKEMALTNNLLVNLDELEAIRPSQHAALKQTLSKNKVNGRPIFGKAQDDRPRYASFVSTTNNPHPLTDATGSRRYICLRIPKGQLIDNAGDIDYDQLYAQVLYEIQVLETPYWFNNTEVARIQQLNLAYMQQKDIAEMVKACFRKPKEGEKVKSMNTTEMLEIIRDAYPNVAVTTKAKVELGRALVSLDYEHKSHSNVAYYKAVPLHAA